MTIFDNHSPIDLSKAQEMAKASRDGGRYRDVGHDTYQVMQGKSIHLIHSYSSGCEYNGRVDRLRLHLGKFADAESLVEFLLHVDTETVPQWAINGLLQGLDYPGEPA